jgi:hypothetical protein
MNEIGPTVFIGNAHHDTFLTKSYLTIEINCCSYGNSVVQVQSSFKLTWHILKQVLHYCQPEMVDWAYA